jgi:hypothetical protein
MKASETQFKKKIKKLPINFFEQLLDLEMNLKREFKIDGLKELVHLYSVL